MSATAAALTLPAFLAIAADVAPQVHARTLAAVVRTESGFQPNAVGVNGAPWLSRSYGSRAEAEAAVVRLMAQGYRSLDLGAAQINTAAGHLQKRGLPLGAAFDPRIGIRIGGEVLADCWTRAAGFAQEQQRLDATLGCYNTGRLNPTAPYVLRVRASAEVLVPALRLAGETTPAPSPSVPTAPAPPAAPPCAPAWDSWALARCNAARARPAPRPQSEDGRGAVPVPAQPVPPEFP